MAQDRFLIAPLESGLITEATAWQIPEDAFARLKNAYIHKGVVRKRFGSQLMGGTSASTLLDQLKSRLRLNIDTTDGAGAASGTVPGQDFEVGQLFSVGDEIFTVDELGTPGVLLTTGAATTHTFDTTSGAFVFAGAAATTDVYYYPAQPVMGISHFENNSYVDETNPTYAFDQQFIYKYSSGAWERSGDKVLHGSIVDFVWAANWTGVGLDDTALFMSNFNATIGTPDADDDPMYALKGGTWAEFRPVYAVKANVVDGYVQAAKIVIPFKDRLLLLNTIERDVTASTNAAHVNRCRFCHNGSPFPADVPDDVEAAVSSAWLEVNQEWTIGATTKKSDGAGWIDDPTEEEITSAEFIKDKLVVYFEHSTWELAYTGNQVQPFMWKKLNAELGTKALKSAVSFDKAILTVGTSGIHGCTGVNVAKINEKISDQTFEIRRADYGQTQVCGIRDYLTELVYWSLPSINAEKYSQDFPDKVLMYDYGGDSWGIADDCITAFGHYEEQAALTWESTNLTWQEANFKWDSASNQKQFKQVIAGNHQGFTFTCDAGVSSNAASMQVTKITDSGSGIAEVKIINHMLNNGDFLELIDMTGITFTDAAVAHNYKISVVDADTIKINATFTGAYIGGGRAARVSRIDILSKQWNFYIDKGKNFFLAKIDFAVLRTELGKIKVDYYPSATELSMIDSGNATESILGDNTLDTFPYEDLYPLEGSQKRLWHPVYFQTEGECVQIRMYLSDAQLSDQDIANSDFQLEGLVVHASPTSERLQ
jgi:hypothetical protein